MGRDGAGNVQPRRGCEPRTKEKWKCLTCVDGKGDPYVNFGFRTECNSCGLAKGVCFGGKIVSDIPSFSAKAAGGRESKAEAAGKKIKELEKKIKDPERQADRLQAQPQLDNAEGIVTPGMDVDANPEREVLEAAVAKAKDEYDQLAGVTEAVRIARIVSDITQGEWRLSREHCSS